MFASAHRMPTASMNHARVITLVKQRLCAPHALLGGRPVSRDWYFTAEQPAPAPHLARPAGCAAPRIVLVTVPRGSRSIRPDGLQKCHAFLSRFRRLCRSVESFQPVQEVVPSVPVQEVGAISSLQ